MSVIALLGAALHYLVPLGVGLLLTRPLAKALTRTQLLLLSYLVGLVAIACVFVSRERGWGFDSSPERIAVGVFVACVIGFALARRVFRWDGAARSTAVEFVWVLPFFAVGYAMRFGVFSDYPVTDLFQFTHQMKAAVEFGRFDRINPFTAASYAPVLPVLDGLLVRAFGYDPLEGFWFVAALSIAPKFLALRVAVHAFLNAREARLAAVAAAACFVSPLPLTNGGLAILGALSLFASFSRGGDGIRVPGAVAVLLAVAGYIVAHVAVRRLDPLAYLVVVVLACAAERIRPGKSLVSIAPPGILALVVALAPLHRSAMLFVPVGTLCGWLLAAVRNGALARSGVVSALPSVTGAATAAAGIGVAAMAAFFLSNPQVDLRTHVLTQWVVATILGMDPANLETSLGSGPKVALFELARTMSPSFVLATGVVLWLAWRALRTTRGTAQGAGLALAIPMGAWLIALALSAVLLGGVPFTYRAGFLVVVLLAIAWGGALETARARMPEGAAERVLLASALAYVTVVIPIAYRCTPWATCQPSGYLEMARPYVWTLGGACAAAALVALVVRLRRTLPAPVVALTLGSLFAFEFSILTAYFMPYHYGPADRSASAVSHLGREEIELAARLRGLGADVVLLSDPHTLANLKALTGLNGLLSASNLDTMHPQARAKLRAWLRAVLEAGEVGGACAPEPPLRIRDSASAPEFDYWLMRRARPLLSGRDALQKFGYRDALLAGAVSTAMSLRDPGDRHQWVTEAIATLAATAYGRLAGVDPWMSPMVLVVVNRKAVAWALGGGDLPYYPDLRPLAGDLLARLARRCDLRVEGGGRFALIRFPLMDR